MFSLCIFATLAVLVHGQGSMMSALLSGMQGGGGGMGMGMGMGGFRHPSSLTGMTLEGLCNFYSMQTMGDKGVLSDLMAKAVPRLVPNPSALMLNPSMAGSPQYQCLAKVYGRKNAHDFAGAMSDLADGAGCHNFLCFDGLEPAVIANTPENAFRVHWLRQRNGMQGIGGLVAAASRMSQMAKSLAGVGKGTGASKPSLWSLGGGALSGAAGGSAGLGGAGSPGMSGFGAGMNAGASPLAALFGLNGKSKPGSPLGGGANNGMGGRSSGMAAALDLSALGGAAGSSGGLPGLDTAAGLQVATTGSQGAGSPGLDLMAAAGPSSTGAQAPGVTSPVNPAPSATNPVTSTGAGGSNAGSNGGNNLQQLMQQLHARYSPSHLQSILSSLLQSPAV